MRKVREVIVVEGRYDLNAVKQAVSATVVETRGFGILKDSDKTALLRRLAQERGLIVLTDPDGAGFVIRGKLKSMLSGENVKHAYIPDLYGKEKRKTKPSREGKLGVEGVSPEIIINALEKAGATFEDAPAPCIRENAISKADMYALGLSGKPGSALLRKKLLKKLDLPENLTANGLLDVLNILYDAESLSAAVKDISCSDS